MASLLKAAGLVLALAVLVLALPGGAVGDRACRGAAARDTEHPCDPGLLEFTVTPTPDDALIQTNSPCTPLRHASVETCSFGFSAEHARATVALLGDSHALHLRATVDAVAQVKHWRGYSITRHNCPFTYGHVPGRGKCAGWAPRVVRWLRRHPEVSIVFVTGNAGSGVVPRKGVPYGTARVHGFLTAFKRLPKTVKQVVVVRDVPHATTRTPGCVTRELAKHHDAGVRCARPRRAALRRDPAMKAAERFAGDRVHPVSLADYECDERRCFAVVGGILVMRDVGHMTRTWAESLAPYLRRAYNRLPGS